MMVMLNVITNAVNDLDNPGRIVTAYTVYSNNAGILRASAGLTLKDAIEYFVLEYSVVREDIRLQRPFERQEDYLRRHGVNYYERDWVGAT